MIPAQKYVNDISIGCHASEDLIQEYVGKIVLPKEGVDAYLRFNLPIPNEYIDKDLIGSSFWNTNHPPTILVTQDHFRSLYQILALTLDLNVFRAFLKEHNYY